VFGVEPLYLDELLGAELVDSGLGFWLVKPTSLVRIEPSSDVSEHLKPSVI